MDRLEVLPEEGLGVGGGRNPHGERPRGWGFDPCDPLGESVDWKDRGVESGPPPVTRPSMGHRLWEGPEVEDEGSGPGAGRGRTVNRCHGGHTYCREINPIISFTPDTVDERSLRSSLRTRRTFTCLGHSVGHGGRGAVPRAQVYSKERGTSFVKLE